MSEWIRTDEELPNIGTEVIFAANQNTICGYYAGYNGFHHVWYSSRDAYVFWEDEVKYWMFLPVSPEEG